MRDSSGQRVALRAFDLLRPLLALAAGLMLGATVTLFAGENPFNVLLILARSAFGSPYDLGMSLFYATPLIFTGLSVAVAFRAGLFNIGAEGQLLVGSMAAVATGILLPTVVWPVGGVLASAAAFVAGAFWGYIPGWLKAKRGSHEVITTIMLNFVAAGLTSWLVLYLLRNPNVQAPETLPVGAGYLLPSIGGFEDAPVTWALPLGLLVAALVAVFLTRTPRGFELGVVGESPEAAQMAAISVGKTRMFAMTLAGGIAGLAGLFDVLGASGRFKLGFSAEYGFAGIAVALLGRSRPLGVVAAALLFGALHKGATDLDFETDNVTRDLATVLQACVILTVAADGLWESFRKLLAERTLRSRLAGGGGGAENA